MDKLKAVSLFCGCGGSDLGLEGGFMFLNRFYKRNPVEIVYANDIEKSACEIYNANFNIISDNRDIKEVSSSEIPDHDILVGGFPCQSFSIVAQNPKRLGYKDKRGKLFFEICRILKDKQPICFIAENVKGLLSANNGAAFPLIIKEFEKCGYRIDFKLLNAATFGVPQKRERVFIIGFREDWKIKIDFPKTIFATEEFIPLSKIIFNNDQIHQKYYFSKKAIDGLHKSNKSMNKGRGQDINKPCNTVGAHLAKVSLNSTDPVLKMTKAYRRFLPREVARIQSFPDTFNLIGTDSEIYKALGNAIPPVLMWHVVQNIINIIGFHRNRHRRDLSDCIITRNPGLISAKPLNSIR